MNITILIILKIVKIADNCIMNYFSVSFFLKDRCKSQPISLLLHTTYRSVRSDLRYAVAHASASPDQSHFNLFLPSAIYVHYNNARRNADIIMCVAEIQKTNFHLSRESDGLPPF